MSVNTENSSESECLVRLEEEYYFGSDGTDSSPNSPMFRAIQGVLRDGQPNNRLTAAYFMSEASSPPRWFGVFVRTAGRRVTFFPSTNRPYRLLTPHKNGLNQKTIDHFTIDSDYRRSHLTAPKSRMHHGLGPTREIQGSRHWFTIHYQNEVFMHSVCKRSEFDVPVPMQDAERRIRELNKAREDQVFAMLRLNPTAKHTNHNHLGFSVFVGKPEFANIEGIPHLPNGRFIVVGNAFRIHRLKLDDDAELQISTYCVTHYFDDSEMTLLH